MKKTEGRNLVTLSLSEGPDLDSQHCFRINHLITKQLDTLVCLNDCKFIAEMPITGTGMFYTVWRIRIGYEKLVLQ
jgi:hypothetical protein